MFRSSRLFTALVFLGCISLAACNDSGSSASSASSTPSLTVASPSASSTNTSSSTSTSSGFTISGIVSGITDVSVALSGSSTSSTSTDSAGNFSFATLGAGNYTVSPSKTGYVFNPVSRAATIASASLTGLSFTATASTSTTYTISGTVVGSVASGVVITLNGTNTGSAVTDLGGNYTFTGLVSGTYTLTASLAGYSFSTPLIVSLSNVDAASKNFTSTTAASGSLAFTALSTLPQATVGSPYSSSVVESISGGTAPYYYESGMLTAGTPPLGMIVNPNGKLTGTPIAPGQYDFSVCANDAAGDVSPCQATSITVVAAQSTPTPAASPGPTVSLTASADTITAGGSTVLSWSTKNATSCTASGAWTGTKADSGSVTVDPTATATYTLTCAGPGGSNHASALITVDAKAAAPATPTVTLTTSATTIAAGSAATLAWSSKNASSCSASGGWTGSKAVSGTQSVSPTATTTYTLACSGSSGNAQSAATVSVDAAQKATAPASGTSWVYYNGSLDWPGDYSFSASIDYSDKSGAPLSGSADVKVTITSSFGGWLPYAQNWNFNSAGYTKLTFALKPTVANQIWNVFFVKVGDVPVGIYLDPTKYGPAPVVGQWATYTIPLADLGVLGDSIYKFCIHDETGLNNNVWYVDNVGFAP